MIEHGPEIFQGEVWWADLGQPRGAVAGYRRPVVVIQGNGLNQSRIETVVCIPLTSNLKWGALATNLLLPATTTGLPHDSVAQPTNIQSVDKKHFIDRAGKISPRRMEQLFARLDLALGRN